MTCKLETTQKWNANKKQFGVRYQTTAGIIVGTAEHTVNQLLHVDTHLLKQKHVVQLILGEREQARITELPVLAMGKVLL